MPSAHPSGPLPVLAVLIGLIAPVPLAAQWVLDDPTGKALRLIDRLDRRPSSFGVRSGARDQSQASEDAREVGIGIGDREAPTTLRRSAGQGFSSGGSYLHAMPGSPAELRIGETRFVGGSAVVAPREVFIGRSLRVDGMVDHGPGNGVSFDVEEEASVPGAGPVVSSGTQVRTRVHVPEGGTVSHYGHQEESSQDAQRSGGDLQDRAVPGGAAGPGLPGQPPPQPRTRRSRNGAFGRARTRGRTTRSRTGWIGADRLDPGGSGPTKNHD